MSEAKYYCGNCNAEIKATDTQTCPKCGKNIPKVGRKIVINLVETAVVSTSVERALARTELFKEQKEFIKKIGRAIKKVEVESVTLNFGIVSVTLKKKTKGEEKKEEKT